eukprot:UN28155
MRVEIKVCEHQPTTSPTTKPTRSPTTSPSTSPTSTPNLFPSLSPSEMSTGSCVDTPVSTPTGFWYDSDGPDFDCTWYKDESGCETYGNTFENFGMTASDACCVCEDSDDCSPDPCVNGTCIDGFNRFDCGCESVWVGTLCDIQEENCECDSDCLCDHEICDEQSNMCGKITDDSNTVVESNTETECTDELYFVMYYSGDKNKSFEVAGGRNSRNSRLLTQIRL